jgi:hypothetical protein
MMDRREFFRKAFAAGIVATVPYSIYSEVGEELHKEVLLREIDFGDYDAVLVHNGAVIAKSHRTDLHMEREVIDVSTTGGYREFIPGKLSFDIIMRNVLENTKIETLRRVLNSAEILTIYMKAKDGAKYYGDCYMEALITGASTNTPLTCDIRLRGSGALIMESNEV